MQACPPVSRAEPPPGLSLPHEDMPVPCISEDDYKALCSIAEIKKGSKLKPIPADGLGLQCREHLATTWAEENNISMPTLFDGVRVYRSLTDAEDKRHARILQIEDRPNESVVLLNCCLRPAQRAKAKGRANHKQANDSVQRSHQPASEASCWKDVRRRRGRGRYIPHVPRRRG